MGVYTAGHYFITQAEGDGNLPSVKAGWMDRGHGFVLTKEGEEWLQRNLPPSFKVGEMDLEGRDFVQTTDLHRHAVVLHSVPVQTEGRERDDTRGKLTTLA